MFLNTEMPDTSGYATIKVFAGGNFQQALDTASCGTIIELEAGATFSGNFILKNRAECAGKWIIVTSSRAAELPPSGRRVRPSDAPLMPKILVPNAGQAIYGGAKISNYRFVGVEIGASYNYVYNLVFFDPETANPVDVPKNIIFDRVYLHGEPTFNVRRGIGFNAAFSAVIDSYLSEIHMEGFDSQAIGCWSCPGPLKIANNFLEAATENVAFGGATPRIANLVPSDIEIRGNHFYKPVSWYSKHPSYAGRQWLVKNLFETKNSRRLLLEGNVFENNWLEGQAGWAFVFTPRSSDNNPAAVNDDTILRLNIIRHSGCGLEAAGFDSADPKLPVGTVQLNRMLIQDNIWEDITTANWGGDGHLFLVIGGARDVTFDHNTAFQSNWPLGIGADSLKFDRLTYTNNLTLFNTYGIHSSVGSGKLAFEKNCSSYTYGKNVFILNKYDPANGYSTPEYLLPLYPPLSYMPKAFSEVGFTDYHDGNGGDYTLLTSSPYKKAGLDGKDIGADVPAVLQATRGAVSGDWGVPPLPPRHLRLQ